MCCAEVSQKPGSERKRKRGYEKRVSEIYSHFFRTVSTPLQREVVTAARAYGTRVAARKLQRCRATKGRS